MVQPSRQWFRQRGRPGSACLMSARPATTATPCRQPPPTALLQVVGLSRGTVREMLTSTNKHPALGDIPATDVAFAQGVIVKPNDSYSLYNVSGLFYSGAPGAGARRGSRGSRQRPWPAAAPAAARKGLHTASCLPQLAPARRRHQRRAVAHLPLLPVP